MLPEPTLTEDATYRLLIQGIADFAIYMLDTKGTVVSWNAGAERAKGYVAREIIGRHFSQFYQEQDRQSGLPERALATAAEQGKFEGEGWRIRKNGTKLWAHVVIDPIHDESGALIGFAKITRDMTVQHTDAQQAREQERNFRLLVQGVKDYAIYMLDPEGNVANWNAGAERAKGYTAQEIIGSHFSRFYSPTDQQAGLPYRTLATALATGKFEGEGWRFRKDGSRFWAHVMIDPIHDENNTLVGFAKITRDLTQHKTQLDQIKSIRENLDLALKHMSQGLCLFNAQERLILRNDRFLEMLDLSPSELRPGHTFTDLLWLMYTSANQVPADTHAIVQTERQAHLLGTPNTIQRRELVWKNRIVSISDCFLPEGGWVSTIEDVTERRAIERKVTHLSQRDPLTELPNRAYFLPLLSRTLQTLTPTERIALLFIDLAAFKPVNDTFGQHGGDAVLRTVSHRIRNQIRKRDEIARLGGDEFIILMTDSPDMQDAEALANRLLREIAQPIPLQEHSVTIGCSIGIAFSSEHGPGTTTQDADSLIRNAALALHAAQQNGRNLCHVYEAGMEEALKERRDLEAALRRSLAEGSFLLHYQPVINAETGVITSFEALLRWPHPTRGLIPPLDFIPFAEEIGLMPAIDDWVMRTACAEAVSWPDSIKIAVNLSPTRFREPGLVASILACLNETGLPPRRLEVEITETSMIDNIARARDTLMELREAGIHIAMDDFGTGYSSLSFLRDIPFTRIKIDRSFVREIGQSREANAIIRAIAHMCATLEVAATAEGVETELQAALLRNEGCLEHQGYLIGKPLSAEQTRPLIKGTCPPITEPALTPG